ncbi:hypothetical protein [Moorena sp. SIO3I6]|uniref:hypothetical protein n=1 Tax=Moorena sp. SIO3I6 TaxID=2607831 RepID=UPI0013BC4F73|nr:hypothetical protein [Moorena sp. SIO3I6]NEP27811.1 hypothetical protein [Moorena sp. SIO3I6]NEQ83574.1 hypothetical protein [Moorena sp. SIO2I5]
MLSVDALGNSISFCLSPGQACDFDGADVLLHNLSTDPLIAGIAYDADQRVLQRLERQGKIAVIPPKRNRTHLREYDKH